MTIRSEVAELVALGPLPSSLEASEADLDRRAAMLARIPTPLSHEEAVALLGCFGPDDAFGLAWTLLHLVETAPGTLLQREPPESANEWLRRLWARAYRQGCR